MTRSVKVMVQQVKEWAVGSHLTRGWVYLVKGSRAGDACR